jgi:hypothetical protein
VRVGTTLTAIALLLWAGPVAAQRSSTAPPKSLADLAADVVRTTRVYRATLERALPIHEANVQEAFAAVEERRRLHSAGALDRVYVEQAERALARAERDLEEARAALDEADRLLFEAELQQRLARLAPLSPGAYEDSALLIRFNGRARWSLAGVPALTRGFVQAFGHSLPISALGQTPVHDRLGLDHRSAVDVAVHPDSPEGRWLMEYLRAVDIPFIGVRGAVPGSSTGAHVHIGPASPRMLAR